MVNFSSTTCILVSQPFVSDRIMIAESEKRRKMHLLSLFRECVGIWHHI